MSDRKLEPHGRRVRVFFKQPNGRIIDPVAEIGPQFNADAAAPLTVEVQSQCPVCRCWSSLIDVPVPNWGPDYA